MTKKYCECGCDRWIFRAVVEFEGVFGEGAEAQGIVKAPKTVKCFDCGKRHPKNLAYGIDKL